MKRRLLVLFFALFILLPFGFVAKKSMGRFADGKDPVRDYITESSLKIKKLEALSLQEGYILTNQGDTVVSQLAFAPKSKDQFLYVIAKSHAGDYLFYSAKDIKGYSLRGSHYSSYRERNDHTGVYYFIKQEQAGKLTLYYRDSIPFDRSYKCFFTRTGSNAMYYVTLEGEDWSEPTPDDKRYTKQMVQRGAQWKSVPVNRMDINFKEEFLPLVEDCFPVRNKVKGEFYTVQNISLIVKEYNQCKST